MAYVPDAGHVVWLEFDPQAGHEQAGRRPALVVSPARYNGKTGLMICCPMTTRIKGHPFEVLAAIDDQPGAILSDQVKSLDWKARRAKKKTMPTTMSETRIELVIQSMSKSSLSA